MQTISEPFDHRSPLRNPVQFPQEARLSPSRETSVDAATSECLRRPLSWCSRCSLPSKELLCAAEAAGTKTNKRRQQRVQVEIDCAEHGEPATKVQTGNKTQKRAPYSGRSGGNLIEIDILPPATRYTLGMAASLFHCEQWLTGMF